MNKMKMKWRRDKSKNKEDIEKDEAKEDEKWKK